MNFIPLGFQVVGRRRDDEQARCIQMYIELAKRTATTPQLERRGVYAYVKTRLLSLPSTTQIDFCLGLSGGLDSTVLLHLLVRLRDEGTVSSIRAIHINHQLSPHANRWQQHCENLCAQWGVPLKTIQIHIDKKTGESLEACARELRYQQFSLEIQPSTYLICAHQQDDQAETFLLQLLRGSGIAGLSAMPHLIPFHKGHLWRPLLNVSRADLSEYAQAENIAFIEDESNEDLRFDRNYLRHQILPALKRHWPKLTTTISRSATHCAESLELVDELAKIDLEICRGAKPYTLRLSALAQFTQARRNNVIRYFLRSHKLPLCSQKKLQEINRQCLSSFPQRRESNQAQVTWANISLRQFKDHLYFLKHPQPSVLKFECEWDMQTPLVLPAGLGELSVVSQPTQRIIVTVRFRQGGERMHPIHRSGSHPLKKLFQEWQVPPWERDRIPLIFYQDELIVVPGLAESAKAKKLALTATVFLCSMCLNFAQQID